MHADARRPVPRAGQSLPRESLAVLLAIASLVMAPACSEPEAPAPPTTKQPVRASRAERSVILIVLDTVRADHLGSYGYERPTSPQLDRWAERGALFEHAIASSSWTLPSFASIYTGHHPAQHEAGEPLESEQLSISGIREDLPTLAEIFSEAGHATVAFANNPFLHDKFGVARGFADYSFVPASNRDIRSATKTVDLALDWIDRHRGAPFFAMIHLFDPHMDYEPPEPVRGTFTKGYRGKLSFPVGDGSKIRNGKLTLDAADREYVGGSYDEEILFTDGEVGRLLDALAERGILGEGVVVLTADHGEEIFDHGSFEHGHTAYQELLHVPLMMWGAGIEPGRIPTPVSHVDLFPTLLDAAGLALPEGRPGISLLGLLKLEDDDVSSERPILADRTLHGRRHRVLIRWPWKAIGIEGRSAAMLFDLESDPLEQHDLSEARPEQLAAMLAEFEILSPTPDREDHERRAVALDDVIRARLEALGYSSPHESPSGDEDL